MQSCFDNVFEFCFIAFYTRHIYQRKRMSRNRQAVFLVCFGKIMPSITNYKPVFFLSLVIKEYSKGFNDCTFTSISLTEKCDDKIVPHCILQRRLQIFLGFLDFRVECNGDFIFNFPL